MSESSPSNTLEKRYLAGETRQEALERAKLLNKEGIGTILLPMLSDNGEADGELFLQEIKELSHQMGLTMIRGGISFSLSQSGYPSSGNHAMDHLRAAIAAAEEYSIGCWIDMEEGPRVGETLDTFLELRKKFAHLSITLQARLDRTDKDLETILNKRARVRLVKGQFPVSTEPGTDDPAQIRRKYQSYMEWLFSEGAMFALATHDEEILQGASKLQNAHPRMMEFQMWLGRREEKIRSLLFEGGFPVTLVLPYGPGARKHLAFIQELGEI
ncbi:MAG: proline dehydrogenase family protein [Leptospirillum sp.]